jgi:hypothetical protein
MLRLSLSGLDPAIAPPWLPLRYRIALSLLKHLEAILVAVGVTGAVAVGWFVAHAS